MAKSTRMMIQSVNFTFECPYCKEENTVAKNHLPIIDKYGTPKAVHNYAMKCEHCRELVLIKKGVIADTEGENNRLEFLLKAGWELRYVEKGFSLVDIKTDGGVEYFGKTIRGVLLEEKRARAKTETINKEVLK